MLEECSNFQGGTGGKIRENGPKTGNSLALCMEKWEILDQNFGKSPLVSIFRYSVTFLLQYKRIYHKKENVS